MAYSGAGSKTPLGRDRKLAPGKFSDEVAAGFDPVDSIPVSEKRGTYTALPPQLDEKGKRPPIQDKPFKG